MHGSWCRFPRPGKRQRRNGYQPRVPSVPVSTEPDRATVTAADALADRLSRARIERDEQAAVAVLPDRRLRIEPLAGGDDRWQVAVSTDGDTVGKHGPFASPTVAADRAATLAAETVGYTVCCDGRRS